MNKMFFAFLAAIALLPGCFNFFKKDTATIEQTNADSAEEVIAPISDDLSTEESDASEALDESESDEK